MESVSTNTKKAKCLHTGVILRYPPTRITQKAKDLLKEFVKEFGVISRSLGVTLEWAYRQSRNEPMPPLNQTIMSKECQEWCLAEYRDPQLPISRRSNGLLMGTNHSWGSVFTCGPADYTNADPLEIIETIPTH